MMKSFVRLLLGIGLIMHLLVAVSARPACGIHGGHDAASPRRGDGPVTGLYRRRRHRYRTVAAYTSHVRWPRRDHRLDRERPAGVHPPDVCAGKDTRWTAS